MYSGAVSTVRHKNWLMETFPLLCGVHQGCPLSCHLFNIVAQVLIFSLRDEGYFEWWHFINNPYSLYADDIAIFLSDISQLAKILNHIEWVGSFTRLRLNLEKTIAFDPNVAGKL